MARHAATQNAIVGLFESGTYGASSGNFWPGLVQSHNVTPTEGTFSTRYLGGSGRDIDIHVQGAKLFNGELVIEPQDWRFLAWTCGSSTDGGSPSPYAHRIATLNNDVGTAFTSGTLNPFLSFGIEESNVAPGAGNNWVRTIKGCVVDEWELSGEMGNILNNTIRYIGTSGAWSSGTPTAINAFNYGTSAIGSITDRPYIFSDVTVSIPSGTIHETLTNFNLKLGNNLIARHYLTGSRDAAALQPNTRTITLDLGFDAQSERAKTLYETYFQGGSDFNTFMRINASTGSRDNILVLSGCRMLDPFESPLPLEGLNPHTLHIEAKSFAASGAELIQKYAPW